MRARISGRVTSSAKMMLAFVIRQCEIDLGHPPTAAELAAWANNGGRSGRRVFLFGRPISEAEARVILRRPSRLVSAKAAHELDPSEVNGDRALAENVIQLSDARHRLTRRMTQRRPSARRRK